MVPRRDAAGVLAAVLAVVATLATGKAVGAAAAAAPQSTYAMVDPVFTPYFANGTVNYAQIPLYAELCVKNGVDVVLLGGSTAEWPSLTPDERLELLRVWRRALDTVAADAAPTLLFHSGDVSVAGAKYLTSKAHEYGADMVLVVAPCIMRPPTLDALVATMADIAKETSLGMIYYHYPELYGVDFDMADFLTSATGVIPNLVGVKYIDSNMKGLAAATGVASGKYTLYNNDPLLAGLVSGSRGAISYTTIFPTIRKMQQAFESGDFAAAQQLQRTVLQWDSIIGNFGGKPAARSLPAIFDSRIDLGPPRAPLVAISSSGLQGLRSALKTAGLLPSH